jgi:hypothetical protein
LPAAAPFEIVAGLAVDLFDDFAEARPRLAAPEFRPLVPDISTSCSTPGSSKCHELSGADPLIHRLPDPGHEASFLEEFLMRELMETINGRPGEIDPGVRTFRH